MEFNPDQYLAEKSSGHSFDPDAYLATKGAPASPAPGYGETLLRGGAQGLSLGFADELAGAAGAGLDKLNGNDSDLVSNYLKHRDEYRAQDEAAKRANPKTFFTGQIGGGLATAAIPGLNIGKAATLGGRALGAAGLGATAALGNSNADLTKGEFGQAVGDVAKGAAIGAIAQPVLEKTIGALAPAAEEMAPEIAPETQSARPFKNLPSKAEFQQLIRQDNPGKVFTAPVAPKPAPPVPSPAPAPAENPFGGLLKTSMGTMIGGELGSATGIPGAKWVGGAVGGAVANNVLPQIAKKALDAKILINKLSSTPEAKIFIGPIKAAASQGPGALAATHFMLSQTQPAYQAAVNE